MSIHLCQINLPSLCILFQGQHLGHFQFPYSTGLANINIVFLPENLFRKIYSLKYGLRILIMQRILAMILYARPVLCVSILAKSVFSGFTLLLQKKFPTIGNTKYLETALTNAKLLTKFRVFMHPVCQKCL